VIWLDLNTRLKSLPETDMDTDFKFEIQTVSISDIHVDIESVRNWRREPICARVLNLFA
jgi:hypothetical protein